MLNPSHQPRPFATTFTPTYRAGERSAALQARPTPGGFVVIDSTFNRWRCRRASPFRDTIQLVAPLLSRFGIKSDRWPTTGGSGVAEKVTGLLYHGYSGARAAAALLFSVRYRTNSEEFSIGEFLCPFTSHAVVSPQTQSRA